VKNTPREFSIVVGDPGDGEAVPEKEDARKQTAERKGKRPASSLLRRSIKANAHENARRKKRSNRNCDGAPNRKQ